MGQNIYAMRQKTINWVFADAIEKHTMRYTHHRSLARVTQWIRHKYVSMNLKNSYIGVGKTLFSSPNNTESPDFA
jgi:hypothetical protein